jgi:hypothetical protein
MKKLLAATILVCAAALAAGIDGKWVGESQGRNGPQKITLTLKSQGGALTGTIEGAGRGGQGTAEIKNGKIEGNKFSFSVSGGRGEATWEGTVEGDELRGTRTGGGGQGRPFTAKRAN